MAKVNFKYTSITLIMLHLMWIRSSIVQCEKENSNQELLVKVLMKCMNSTYVTPEFLTKLYSGTLKKTDPQLRNWALCGLYNIQLLSVNRTSMIDVVSYIRSEGRSPTRQLSITCIEKEIDRVYQSAWKFKECYYDVNVQELVVQGNRDNYITKKVEDSDRVKYIKLQRPWFFNNFGSRHWHFYQDLKLFPEDGTETDRIVDQLLYSLPNSNELPLKIILMAPGFNDWGIAKEGQMEFFNNKCPINRCSLTEDTRPETADAILFSDQTSQHTYTLSINRSVNQIWIMYLLESPPHTLRVVPSARRLFNWTASYRQDSDIVTPYGKWAYYDPTVTEKKLDRNYAANKTKLVVWVVSNCFASNKRMQFVKELSKYIPVDIFGKCGRPCPSKVDCLNLFKDYKFYIAFENSNCKDYITEKMFANALQHDMLPIVMGARISEYASTAPRNSFIHVEEFTGPPELAAYLHHLDKHDVHYNSYFKWKGTGEFINTNFFCRLCAMLHENDQRRRISYYKDIQLWWTRGMCTRYLWTSLNKTI